MGSTHAEGVVTPSTRSDLSPYVHSSSRWESNLPHWITIASSFVRTDGEVVERVRLMQSKNKDQMRR